MKVKRLGRGFRNNLVKVIEDMVYRLWEVMVKMEEVVVFEKWSNWF